MKNKTITGVRIYQLMLILLTIIWLTAISMWAFSQSVTISPVVNNSQRLVADISYNGPTHSIGAVSAKIEYDLSLLRLDSVQPINQYSQYGNFFYTPYNPDYDFFFISWFAGATDTLFTNGKTMFLVYFTRIADGCALLNFNTMQQEWCELGDLDANPWSVVWIDNTFCYDSGKRSVMPDPTSLEIGRMQFHIINRSLTKKRYEN